MATENPFPLNIENKEDSWEKLQLMELIPANKKYDASEFNKILQALQYLFENLGGEGALNWGNIGGNLVNQEDLVTYIANQIASGSAIKPKEINFGAGAITITAGANTTGPEIATHINNVGFTVNLGELVVFSLLVKRTIGGTIYWVRQKYYFKRNNLAGTWGTTDPETSGLTHRGTIVYTDLILTYETIQVEPPAEADAVYINLGDIGVTSVEGVVNFWQGPFEAFPPLTNNELSDDGSIYYFACRQSNEDRIYRYIGDVPITIGAGGDATIFSDYDLVSSSNAETAPPQVQSDAAVTDQNSPAFIKNKQLLGGGSTNEIIVTQSSQIVNQVLDSTKVYLVDRVIELGAAESIIVPENGLTIKGFGFNISGITTSQDNATIFTSPVAGSGDLIIGEMSLSCTGASSKVFDIEDATGNHAIEIEYVNFNDCVSLGEQNGYRQGTWTTVGIYGCDDGITLTGTWNGYKISNTNAFGFGASGTLFKAGTGLVFSNRFFLNININFPSGAKLADFADANFDNDELFQINASQAIYDSTTDIANEEFLLPNITANSPKSRFTGNIGLPNTALDVLVEDLALDTTYEVDWYNDIFFLEAIADTTITETNLPATGKNAQRITLFLDPKEHTITFPAAWLTNLVGSLVANEVNEVNVTYLKSGVYFVKINNSLTVYPAPSLQSLNPVSIIPSTTAELIINGSFFTPATLVTIEGQTVNSIEFVNQGQLILSVTTGVTEGEFDITINNGTAVTFVNALIVNLGDVFVPTQLDWIDIVNSLNVSLNGQALIPSYNSNSSGSWNRVIDHTKSFKIEFNFKKSPFGNLGNDFRGRQIQLLKSSDDTELISINTWFNSPNAFITSWDGGTHTDLITNNSSDQNVQDAWLRSMKVELIWNHVTEIFEAYVGGQLRKSFNNKPTENLYLRVNGLQFIDIENIKYIELP